MPNTIKEQIEYIEKNYAGTHKEDLLAIWERLQANNQEILNLYLELGKLEKPSEPILQVKLLHPEAKVPTRGSEGAIGWDLYSTESHPISLSPGTPTIINTGIAVAIPHGYYGRVAPRSGLAAKQGIDVLAGVIDEDYRGEVKVILNNTTDQFKIIDLSKPIAQLILERADQGKLIAVSELLATVRGEGGFGSTDRKE